MVDWLVDVLVDWLVDVLVAVLVDLLVHDASHWVGEKGKDHQQFSGINLQLTLLD